jgi:hypothetical protein
MKLPGSRYAYSSLRGSANCQAQAKPEPHARDQNRKPPSNHAATPAAPPPAVCARAQTAKPTVRSATTLDQLDWPGSGEGAAVQTADPLEAIDEATW